jgi:hypothetical protein
MTASTDVTAYLDTMSGYHEAYCAKCPNGSCPAPSPSPGPGPNPNPYPPPNKDCNGKDKDCDYCKTGKDCNGKDKDCDYCKRPKDCSGADKGCDYCKAKEDIKKKKGAKDCKKYPNCAECSGKGRRSLRELDVDVM